MLLGVSALAVLSAAWQIRARTPGTSAGYTAAQAEAGRNAYAKNCASCHGLFPGL